MEPVYQCVLQCSSEMLGPLFPVLSKRRGTVVKDDLREGTQIFDVTAFLPVATSFGFAADLRKNTGGAANPQLLFSHFAVIAEDPFWTPSTVEELEDYGDGNALDAVPNVARDLITSLRVRKGLAVDQKIIKDATKQRTLAKKK